MQILEAKTIKIRNKKERDHMNIFIKDQEVKSPCITRENSKEDILFSKGMNLKIYWFSLYFSLFILMIYQKLAIVKCPINSGSTLKNTNIIDIIHVKGGVAASRSPSSWPIQITNA